MPQTSTRASLRRSAPSARKPSAAVRLLVEQGHLTPEMTAFDLGCGYGRDVLWLRQQGIAANGYDLLHWQADPIGPADAVLLLHVLNVLPSWAEREAVVETAADLATRVLYVAVPAIGASHARRSRWQPWGDGWRTQAGTFVKAWRQTELVEFFAAVLGTVPVAVGEYLYAVSATQRLASPCCAHLVSGPTVQAEYAQAQQAIAGLQATLWTLDAAGLEQLAFYRARAAYLRRAMARAESQRRASEVSAVAGAGGC